MPYYTYVLKSLDHDRYYKGHCGDLDKRLQQHNKGQVKSTKPYAPWKVIYHEEFLTREEAIARERYFKTAAGRRYLKSVLKKQD